MPIWSSSAGGPQGDGAVCAIERGPLHPEVTSSPAFERIETATGKDLAGLMIQEFERKLS